MDADEFVGEVLVERIGAAGLITGDDFSFGKGRSGDVALLSRLCEAARSHRRGGAAGDLDGVRVSSGRVRDALGAADPGKATRLLTRPFAVQGVVQRGDGRGGPELNWRPPTCRSAITSGRPTAFMRCGCGSRMMQSLLASRAWACAATFEPAVELSRRICSGSTGDLYGRTIEVGLHHYIRAGEKFSSIEALAARMGQDALEAKRLLGIDRLDPGSACGLHPRRQAARAPHPCPTPRRKTRLPALPTVFLPKTAFPMKAGLPQKEPAILERWRSQDLYGQVRARGRGARSSSCMTGRLTRTATSISGIRSTRC